MRAASSRPPGVLSGVLVMVWLCGAIPAQAAFEIDPIGPDERGCAMELALGPRHTPGRGDSVACRTLSVYGFKPFGTSEITFAAVSASLPVGADGRVLTLSYERLEALAYREEVYSAAFGFGLERAFIQPEIRLGTARSEAGFADWAILPGISVTTGICEGLEFAAEAENPFGLGLLKEGSPSPQQLAIGLGLRVTPDVTCGFELVKPARFPTCVASGLEWRPSKSIALRAGLRTYPKEFCFGVGFGKGPIAVDVASSSNLELGVTNEAGVTFSW